MNIITKLTIATTAAVLLLISVNGDEKKMPKVPKSAPLAVKSGEEPKAEPTQVKTATKSIAPKPGARKSGTQQVAAAKKTAPATSPEGETSKTAASSTKSATAPVKAVADLTPSQVDKVLALLNQGTKEELAAIKGVAGTRAESIVSARPFKSVDDLILVPGVGDVTVDRIVEYGIKTSQSPAKSVKS